MVMLNGSTEKTEIPTRNGKVWKDDNGIIRYTVNKGVVERIENAKEMIEAIISITGKAKHHTLIDIRGLKSTDKATRDYYASREVFEAANGGACAILVGSPITAVIGNMFIRVNTPPYMVKLFFNEEKASDWLLGMD